METKTEKTVPLSCPFCGAGGEVVNLIQGSARIGCSNSKCIAWGQLMGPFASREIAIQMWNQRKQVNQIEDPG